jgi:hypothetical protein
LQISSKIGLVPEPKCYSSIFTSPCSYRMIDWGTKNAEWQQVSTFRFRVAEHKGSVHRAIPSMQNP